MAGSLKTAFFNLAKYAANDITSWLTDFNGNMDKIDTALNKNKTAVQTAQDGVDNLESEYESLLGVVNEHTTSISSIEKGVQANTTAIEGLENDFNSIEIGNNLLYGFNSGGLTKMEPLLTTLNLTGRRIGDFFSGSFGCLFSVGTLRTYDRNGNVAGGNYYIHDLVRINGNPFNLKENIYTPMVGALMYINGTEIYAGFYVAIAYIPDSNFTVIGYCSPNSNDVQFTAKTMLFVSC